MVYNYILHYRFFNLFFSYKHFKRLSQHQRNNKTCLQLVMKNKNLKSCCSNYRNPVL